MGLGISTWVVEPRVDDERGHNEPAVVLVCGDSAITVSPVAAIFAWAGFPHGLLVVVGGLLKSRTSPSPGASSPRRCTIRLGRCQRPEVAGMTRSAAFGRQDEG
jgi:hypothetical protein